ncbi:conserved Plasmodium protein, unknown function [Plasmodium gallinaceum]|uniref:Uncharacterized protein n=1 Tax=Plasmodium gallinaceum TaxID=5849 RepID=A0A1J1GYM5_PLAGA|nr:conserved Plasmodium protein, unknown function [Plasmodium gallinaceum]CRG97337.1 conserved Plasmodium protein, unknown function [Plasmodium gallinaceum]
MDDYLNEDSVIKHKAWNLHFMDKRKNNKFKYSKKKNMKYNVKWIKKKDNENLFERWIQIKTLNENYNSEEEKEKDETKKQIGRNVLSNNNETRKSYRLNLQSILNENNTKKNYVDPSSDISSEEQENDNNT